MKMTKGIGFVQNYAITRSDYHIRGMVHTVTILGSRSICLLRLEEARKQSSSYCAISERDVMVKVIKPGWWSAEWTQVLEQ